MSKILVRAWTTREYVVTVVFSARSRILLGRVPEALVGRVVSELSTALQGPERIRNVSAYLVRKVTFVLANDLDRRVDRCRWISRSCAR